jgi:hypothetical protein
MTMITCLHCKASLMDGTLLCEKCGFSLINVEKHQSMTSKLNTETNGLKIRSGWGTATLRQERQLLIYVHQMAEPIRVTPKDGFLIGRKCHVTGTFPDLDLGPFEAVEKGVSRRHASLSLRDSDDDILSITDLGSANGTFLNGVRIGSNQSRIVRDGDEIRLANMKLHFYFA